MAVIRGRHFGCNVSGRPTSATGNISGYDGGPGPPCVSHVPQDTPVRLLTESSDSNLDYGYSAGYDVHGWGGAPCANATVPPASATAPAQCTFFATPNMQGACIYVQFGGPYEDQPLPPPNGHNIGPVDVVPKPCTGRSLAVNAAGPPRQADISDIAGEAARAEAIRALAPIYGFAADVVEQLGNRLVRAVQPYNVPAAGTLSTQLVQVLGGHVLASGTQTFDGPSVVVRLVMRYTSRGLRLARTGQLRRTQREIRMTYRPRGGAPQTATARVL